MKGIVLRLLLFAMVYVAAGHVIKALLPYYWGDPWWRAKGPILHRMQPSPRVFFLGSSRTLYHIIPGVFDSLGSASGRGRTSFNLGAPAVFPPQTYQMLEDAVESGDIPRGSTVFLELSEFRGVDPALRGTARGSFWLNAPGLFRTIEFAARCLPASSRYPFIESHVLGFVQNTMHWGQYRGMIGNPSSQVHILPGRYATGFQSLDKEFELAFNDEERKNYLTGRIRDLERDTTLLERQSETAARIHRKVPAVPCSTQLEWLQELQAHCQQREVTIVHVLPSKPPTNIEWALFHALPRGSRIDMSDPQVNPEFYQHAYRFDEAHLNERGAALYTQRLAEAALALGLVDGTVQPGPALTRKAHGPK